MRTPILLGTFAALAIAPSAQASIHKIFGHTVGDRFGISSDGIGDIDGDGRADFAVGASQTDPAQLLPGYVEVFSGATGAMMYHVSGSAGGDELGLSVAGIGDFDGDGVPDFAAGAPGATVGAGAAHVYSGATGAKIASPAFAGAMGDRAGTSICGAGDINGDGFVDLAVGAPGEDMPVGLDAGSVRIYAGPGGALLFAISGDGVGDSLGHSVDRVGDVDLDGLSELVVGAPYDDNTGLNSGNARIVSGAGGGVLVSIDGTGVDHKLGWAVAGGGDVDGDGVPDAVAASVVKYALSFSGLSGAVLGTHKASGVEEHGRTVELPTDWNGDGQVDILVGGPGATSGMIALKSTKAILFDAATGNEVYSLSGSASAHVGRGVGAVGDVNADGAPDFAIGEPLAGAGKITVIAAPIPPASLVGLPTGLSLTTGGVQSLVLNAPADFGGLPYLVLGSVSGTDPGFPIDGHTLPLNVDAYTLHGLMNPNTPPLSSSFGTLDAVGKGTAGLHLPVGLAPTLAGTSIHHAYVVIELLPTLLHVVFVSDPAELALLP